MPPGGSGACFESRTASSPVTGTIVLRAAGPADVGLLRRWDAEPHLADALGDDDWAWETELHRAPEWREQLLAELDGRPFAFVQIIDPAREDSRYWGDVPAGLRALDIWVGEPDLLGQGLGTRVMRLAIDRCFADPAVTAILIDPLASNPRAHRFYERAAGLTHVYPEKSQ